MTAHHRTAAWSKVQRQMRPRIAATLPAPCINRCGKNVTPDQQWDIGHIVSVTAGGSDDPNNLGAAHVRCNRSDGGKEGRAKQLALHKKIRRLPSW
jgi:hypothetical protein